MNDVTMFFCRDKQNKSGCSTSSCNRSATTACTHKLHGKKEGQRCGLPLCTECGGSSSVCPPHQRMERKAVEPARAPSTSERLALARLRQLRRI